MIKNYGYVRVSTKEQNPDRQLKAMAEAGIECKNIFMDKESGKDFDRPAYKRMLRKLTKDSVLFIKSIDRLGRNYREIMEEWRYITQIKGADIVVLAMPVLDTRRHKNLMGTFISDLVLQLLSFVAENERCNIRQRQAEGIAAAKKKGVRFGRPQKPVPDNFHLQCKLWHSGQCTLAQAAAACQMPLSTFYSKCRDVMK
ncbi:putative recombinase [Selenomonas ruminantium subsp. lactilytica TAM6421]|uniref:Putative recombinase n=1 Tax=Selenomonas ruminantium subsp. lactilytica (strain NBRC 103574 / TAM6421) TaxID=927704 RepID=I0GN61_SELRL|nr:recombinase family protein [Selenomonas ruminantium]BAL82198.1 putative recombinase [Selenomonas ruminantium subsp. lactilytica TAM6421]